MGPGKKCFKLSIFPHTHPQPGPPPPPKLQALWTGKVLAGSDVVLRCQSKVPGVIMELLRGGKIVPYRIHRVTSSWSDLGLPLVGPRHTGNYTCRYTSWDPDPFHSEPSNPVELIVEGMTSRGLRLGFACLSWLCWALVNCEIQASMQSPCGNVLHQFIYFFV